MPSRTRPSGVASPQPNRTYSGPDVPTAYDPNWQFFNNLTFQQVEWFQAQPEWQNFTAWVALNPATATINANVAAATIDNALSVAGKATLGTIS